MMSITATKLPPELELVIACSRWPPDEREVQARAVASIDWGQFLKWIRRNRIASLVDHNLRQTSCAMFPEAVVAKLRSDAAHNARRVLIQIAEAERITRLLADAGIRSMVIKGSALSVLAFGDPTLRESHDIDLLVDPARMLEADRLIIDAGYRRITPNFELTPFQYGLYERWRCQMGYYLDSLETTLELHWRLTANSALIPLDGARFFSRSQSVPVAGTSFNTLPDQELFLYLCVHGSVHMWFRLKWLADIAALLHRVRPEMIDRIASRAQTLGVGRPFHVALILAHDLMGAPVPSDILTTARKDRAARKLAIAAIRALNWQGSPREPGETPWFYTWLNWHAFQLKPGLRYRWRELQNQAQSPEDWARVRLPQQLFFLYLPLRPLSWVLRKTLFLVGR
jgi:hypothetical protein